MNNLAHSSKAESIKRNLEHSFYESTPVYASKSRKRKSLTLQYKNDIYHSPKSEDSSKYESCISVKSSATEFLDFTDVSLDFNDALASSRLDKTSETANLSGSLEKCCLLDSDVGLKRTRLDCESPNRRRKSNSAPGTPQHSGTDAETSIKKYHSMDFTPKKSYSDVLECKKILYPELVEHKLAFKPKSPEKLRAEIKRGTKRLNKPAKKRLFVTYDFVYLFTHSSNNREIVYKIFSYLNDSDLVNISKVSKLWKLALCDDRVAYQRYRRHSNHLIRSKENLRSDNFACWGVRSATKQTLSIEKENLVSRSPVKTNWQKFTKLAANLATNQQLTKCPTCGDPSVLERNIAQCTKHGCQYIWCVRCLSGSKMGPEHFVCKCEKGTTPPRTDNSRLGDISNIESPKNCSFLNEQYYNCSFNNTGNTSSGYFSQSDVEKSHLNSSKVVKSALSDSNRRVCSEKVVAESDKRISSYHSVAEICMRKKLHKKSSSEPSSPPKIKMPIVGSQKSKKNLRRLCL